MTRSILTVAIIRGRMSPDRLLQRRCWYPSARHVSPLAGVALRQVTAPPDLTRRRPWTLGVRGNPQMPLPCGLARRLARRTASQPLTETYNETA